MNTIKDIQQIKTDYENLVIDLENLIDSVVQKYRQEVESEINSVCVQVMDDDNSTKLHVIVITPKDLPWFRKYEGKSFSEITRPATIMGNKIRELIGKETEDFIVRYTPEFFFWKEYNL